MATPRKNTATGQDVSGDLVAPDGTSAAGSQELKPVETSASVAPVEAPAAVTTEDVRAAKLDALLNGVDAEAEAPAVKLDYDPNQEPVDFGGRTVCVVTFSYWNALVDGLFRRSRKGVLIKVTADEADRGEALGGLRRVEL